MPNCGPLTLTPLLFFHFLNFQTAFANPDSTTKVEPSKRSEVFSAEEVDQIAGQFVMIGLSGTTLTDSEIKAFRAIKPGGVILFKRNISSFLQVAKLNLELQKLSYEVSGHPLLISIDQEGGRVARLQISPSMPSALAMGMTNDQKLVEEVSIESARLLKALGLNMNLAPVLDVIFDNTYSFIGERSFGVSPENVANLGAAFAQGQLRSGIIPTSKHFPGAGMIQRDPHLEKINADHLSAMELGPFKAFAQIYPSAMMMSHASYPSLDSSGMPATYSPRIMRKLLREEWNYKGIIITDDMMMKGAELSTSRGKSAVQSIKAGADMVMVSWGVRNQISVKKAILAAIKNGRISKEDIQEKFERMKDIKRLIHANMNPRMPAAEMFVYESKKMYELDNRILDINLTRDLQQTTFSSRDQFAVITSDQKFIWALERALGKRVYKVDPHHLTKYQVILKESDIVIVPINSRKLFYQLSSLDSKIKKKSILILLAQPVQLSIKSYLSVVKLFHPHKELAKRLGQLIRQKSEMGQIAVE